MKETHIRNRICSWLRFHGALPLIYDNVGIYDQKLGRYRVRNNIHRILGVSDLIVFFESGRYAFIEVKTATGRLSEHQTEFIRKINSMGGVAFVARDEHDVERELRAHGILP